MANQALHNNNITNDEEDQITSATTTRSGRVIRRPGLQGRSFEPDGNKHNFATNNSSKTPTVYGFLCAQTTYINSLTTFGEVNTATQYATEYLILTQVGMKRGIKLWGEDSVAAIIKEM